MCWFLSFCGYLAPSSGDSATVHIQEERPSCRSNYRRDYEKKSKGTTLMFVVNIRQTPLTLCFLAKMRKKDTGTIDQLSSHFLDLPAGVINWYITFFCHFVFDLIL